MTSWPNSIRIIAVIIAVVGIAVSPAAAQNDEERREELEATIAALQTQAAELEPETTDTPASTPTAAGEWNTATVAGNGFEVLTPAPVGSVDVIAVGTYDGQTLPFVIHNNTETAIEDVSIQGTVMDSDGDLFAVGEDTTFNPGWIEAGAVGVGEVYFERIEFPAGATVDMIVSYDAADSRGSLSSLEATVAEWNQVDDRIVGSLTNPHSTDIIEPIAVNVVCLAEDGSVDSFNEDYTASSSIPVGGQVPFQVTLDSPSCDHILIVADGFNW